MPSNSNINISAMTGLIRISGLTLLLLIFATDIQLGFTQNDGLTQRSNSVFPLPWPSSYEIESIITEDFFERVRAGISDSCEGKNFYTYNGFIDAATAQDFSSFGTTGNLTVRKRELAAYWANIAHETGSLCYVEEIQKSTYCEPSEEYPCAPGKQYYGRGPIQLTWNYNYGAAGKYMGLPLLSDPDIVAQRPDVAFKASLWFWVVNSNCHKSMTSPEGDWNGFGGTIRAINGGECDGRRPTPVKRRVDLYTRFCGWLNITTGPNLTC